MRGLWCVLATTFATVSLVNATNFSFVNKCPYTINLWDNKVFKTLNAQGGQYWTVLNAPSLMWRHGYDPHATLAEFTVDPANKRVWYDISIIPPGSGNCSSYTDCQRITNGGTGFNVPLAIVPMSNVDGSGCRKLTCLADRCDDAFQYPGDTTKVHVCPDSTEMRTIFCPDAVATTQPTYTILAKSKFTYSGAQAGNVPGTYSRVTSLTKQCDQRQTISVLNPVGPMSEEVTMIFRGPLEIYNLAVFDGSSGIWQRVSWYRRGGERNNMAFFNNRNIDYSGQRKWGPQSFASADGRYGSTMPVPFSGSLGDASNPNAYGGGPGVSTGVEVNILTERKCQPSNPCPGYTNDYSYHGWGGGRKIFVSRISMPMSGGKPNIPAMWMLNTQVVYVGQYDSCNCRGMGAAGGCGELDIAEVINNQNPNLDRVSTHYYFFDGSVQNPYGGDNYGARPTTKSTVYITIIDNTVGNGIIKILELDTFNFALDKLTNSLVQRWINA